MTKIVKTLTTSRHQNADMDKQSLAEIARFARIRAGFAKEEQAAKAIGCSRTLIISWENGSSTIRGSKYQLAAARAYRVRHLWLTEGLGDDGFPTVSDQEASQQWSSRYSSQSKDETSKILRSFFDASDERSAESHPETRPGYVRFELLEAKGGAGPGVVNPDYPEVLQEVEIAEWQLIRELGRVPSPRRVKLLTVRGNSMSPRIREGDVVFVDIEDTAPVDGAIFAVIIHDETLVKQIERRIDGLHIVSLAYPERPDVIPPDKMDALKIAGRVVGAIQLRKAQDL